MRLKLISMAVSMVFAFILPGSLHAQKSTTPEDMAKTETDKMKEKLNLTDEQTIKVGDINLKYARQMNDIRQQNSQASTSERQANREKIKGLREKKSGELKTVLTPEQFEQYQKMEEEMRKEHKKH